ncbi:MAG TPA: DtxR family transcriptional regulator [Bryobacteraceae bacterium]|nr:DtxR family transcriptional regulator [Bryobacteraceae bacterium]
MPKPSALSASLEDYLEAIFHIASTRQVARAKDISARLNVTNSSVTGALRMLAARGLVNYAPYDLITLTPMGAAAAKEVIRRHEALRDFFVKVLSVDSETADAGACKMEHEIPGTILERFIQFVEFMEVCPRAGAKWVRDFGYSCRGGAEQDRCAHCVQSCLEDVEARRKARPRAPAMTLGDLKAGQRARLIRIGGRGESHRRLVDMGMVPGAILGVERIAPLGDPIDIKLRGYHYSVRKTEAALVKVAAIGAAGEVFA